MARTPCAPLSITNERTVRIPGAATSTQTAMRTINGSATAHSVIPQTSASQASHAEAARRDGRRSIRLDEKPAERGVARIVWDIACDEIPRNIRVGQFEKLRERNAFIAWRGFVAATQVTHEQQVQLFHAAPATPFEPAEISAVVQSSSS